MGRLGVLLVIVALSLVATSAVAGPPDKVKVIIAFQDQPGAAEQALVRDLGGSIKYTYDLVPAIAASVPESAIAGLLAQPGVVRVERDLEVHAVDAELDNSWGVKQIGAGTVHDGGNMGTGIRVAVLDTGIDTDHPDLKYNAGCSYDFVNSDTLPEDGWGHGTHVSGTIAAEYNGEGVVGVAPEAIICAYKVLDDTGSGYYSDIMAALGQAVDDDVQVTNNSYGSSGDPGESVKAAFDEASAAGIIHVAAAGNSGTPPGRGENCIYPALWDSVIAVAATDKNDKRASFSSTCPELELAAPGVKVNSTWVGGGYHEKSGTSMASPHVAGTAALVIASGITDDNGDGHVNDEVRLRLRQTADDLGETGPDSHYGFGLVNAAEAAASGNSPPSVAIEDPTDGQTISGTYRVKVSASDSDSDGSITTVELSIDGGDYIDITEDRDGTTYYYDWDTTTAAVAEGSHTLDARATDDEGATVNASQITVQVDNGNDPPVASFTYTCSGLTCDFDGSASTDPDGTIASYAWDFGDNTDSGETVSPSHTYAAADTYMVVLTVTDDDGDTGTDSQEVTVTDATGTVHVGDLDGDGVKMARGNWRAEVTITVHDGGEGLVDGATVSGTWTQNGTVVGKYSCVTGDSGSGQCKIDSDQLPSKSGKATFTVDGVTYSGYEYVDADNHDPDGDSDGTSITVSK